MIQIPVEIDGQELPLDFEFFEGAKGNYWFGNSPVPDEGVTIPIINDKPDFNRMSVSLGIATPKIIIFNRFLNAISDLQTEIEKGFEPTENLEEDVSQSSLYVYDADQIKVRRDTYSVFEIYRMLKNEEHEDIDLNPEFQRNFVWDNTRKSQLIESILLGIPIPVFYFSESKEGSYHVIDGLQRLTTIKMFMDGEFALKGLEYLKDCEGQFFSEDNIRQSTKILNRKYTRRIENAQFVINIIEATSPDKVKYDIFKRLNTGGRPLNRQEVRNCMAKSHIRKYLRDCAHSNQFLIATDGSINDIRMDAQEMVLRFTGFYLERKGIVRYYGEMNSFLDLILEEINKMNEDVLKTILNDFLTSMAICYHLFGRYCFRKCLTENLEPNAKKQFINKSLFVTFSIEVLDVRWKNPFKVNFGSFAKILAKELDKRGRYFEILTTGTSDKLNLLESFEYAKRLLHENI
jgi:uncharacterized protein with ParB-like and HNH nuclease domain